MVAECQNQKIVLVTQIMHMIRCNSVAFSCPVRAGMVYSKKNQPEEVFNWNVNFACEKFANFMFHLLLE